MSLGYQLLYWVIKVIACSAYDMISRVRLVYTCTWFIERLDIVGVKAT